MLSFQWCPPGRKPRTGPVLRCVWCSWITERLLTLWITILWQPRFLGCAILIGVARWICDFLMDRRQRVKLSSDCFSEWGPVPFGVPQGTKLGPWLFILMIYDLHTPGFEAWKSAVLVAVTAVEQWSITNKPQLNPDKCKELLIDFKRTQHQFDVITVNSKELERVNSVKLLGVTIASTLQWNCHISDVLKKANKRMFFLK